MNFALKDTFKGYTLDQDKALTPAETVDRLLERLGAIDLDILEKAVRIDNGRLDIPVFISFYGKDARAITGIRKQMGKGATPKQAEASALMELAERFSFFSFSNDPNRFVTGTFRQFTENALPYSAIARSVHDETDDAERIRSVFESLVLRWTEGWNLSEGRGILVPFDWFYAINAFNGTSAGNCAEEALVQGISEIVERHVCSLISRNRIPVPGIRPESATDPLVREMLCKYERNGIILHVSDFTLDMGIPTVGVLAFDPATFPKSSEIVWTAGTTPNPEKAFSRALTEIAQLAGDFNSGSRYEASGLPKPGALEDVPFIVSPDRWIDLQALPNLSDDNLRIEVERCVSALAAKNLEVILIDTMHPDLRIPAFYTLIPGAHFRERAASGSVGMFVAKLVCQNYSPKQSFAVLQQMAALLPNTYYLPFYTGTILFGIEQHEQAITQLHLALDRNPPAEDRAAIHSYLGQCYKSLGKYHEAIETLEKGLTLDPGRTDILNLLGFCRFKTGDHETAVRCFEAILKEDPGSAIDHANLAVNLQRLDRIPEAIRHFKLALRLDPGIDFARSALESLSPHQSD
ncbi:YcaO-like family protein [Desulfatirhabdium butyrativorans]|uniref:YcaO-like family protein n=1 Tax=Desulfatirhabdium butyrativorans TaxID=340467 RepID=UPI000424D385|nr:YcaO-like family protein [Desulfatirhabdium butyrativorans]